MIICTPDNPILGPFIGQVIIKKKEMIAKSGKFYERVSFANDFKSFFHLDAPDHRLDHRTVFPRQHHCLLDFLFIQIAAGNAEMNSNLAYTVRFFFDSLCISLYMYILYFHPHFFKDLA